MLSYIRNLPPHYWFLLVPFALVGPLMVFMPRVMWAWVVYTAIAVIPVIRDNWEQVRRVVPWNAFALFGVALLYSVISAAWSPSTQAVARAIDLSYISIFCSIICLGFGLLEQNQRRVLLTFFSIGWFIGFLLFLREVLLDYPIHRWFNALPADVPVAENMPKRVAALFALSVWPFALFLEMKGRRLLGVLAILAYAILCYKVGNRSALAGLVSGLFILIFGFHAPKTARRILLMLVLAGLILIIPAYLAIPLLPKEAFYDKLFASAQARLEIWSYTAQHVLESPFIGHGIDASRGIKSVVTEATPYLEAGVSRISQHPHNFFLQIWLDFGLVGAALWGALLVMLVHSFKGLPPATQPFVMAATICSLLMFSTTFSPLQAWWAGGHGTVMAIFLVIVQSISHKEATKGTSAGGIG